MYSLLLLQFPQLDLSQIEQGCVENYESYCQTCSKYFSMPIRSFIQFVKSFTVFYNNYTEEFISRSHSILHSRLSLLVKWLSVLITHWEALNDTLKSRALKFSHAIFLFLFECLKFDYLRPAVQSVARRSDTLPCAKLMVGMVTFHSLLKHA